MMSRDYKIYLVINKINNKKYVGITKQPIEKRFLQHCSGISVLSEAIRKHGKQNFTIETVFQTFTEEDMVELENQFIIQHKTFVPNGYNRREGGKYGTFTDEVKREMSAIVQKRWDEHPEIYVNGLKAIAEYVEAKKERVVGVNIQDGMIVRYNCITDAISNGTDPRSTLAGSSRYSHGYTWYYDEGFSDAFYQDLAKLRIGEFGSYSKGRETWNNCDKEARINAMIESAKGRAKPLIAVSRFDGSIMEFPSVNDAIKKGYSWGGIRQPLQGENKHGYDHCWFYKEIDDVNVYVEKARAILGGFNDTNIRPIVAINIETSERIEFKHLDETEKAGFEKKAVRQVLIGRRKVYRGYTWKFKSTT